MLYAFVDEGVLKYSFSRTITLFSTSALSIDLRMLENLEGTFWGSPIAPTPRITVPKITNWAVARKGVGPSS